jgi:hypothetical protein
LRANSCLQKKNLDGLLQSSFLRQLRCDAVRMALDEGEAHWKNPHIEEIRELDDQITSHAGGVAYARITELSRSYQTWFTACGRLRDTLKVGETDREMGMELMQNVRPPDKRDAYVAELDSKLQAFLASMVALVDITRKELSHYEGESFKLEFDRRNSAVFAIAGVPVIRKLRNIVLHSGNAPWQFGGEFDGVSEITYVMLESKPLLESDTWNAKERAYISAQPHGVQLSEILAPYHDRMADCYGWLLSTIEQRHEKDFEEGNAMIRRRNLLLTGGEHDGSSWQDFMALVQSNLNAEKDGRPTVDWQDVKGDRT